MQKGSRMKVGIQRWHYAEGRRHKEIDRRDLAKDTCNLVKLYPYETYFKKFFVMLGIQFLVMSTKKLIFVSTKYF